MRQREIHYKIPWRARSNFPGAHPSQQQGGGQHFRHHVPLLQAPDPRRFDVRASLKDPFEQLYVRLYQQTSAIPVYVVADLSASMGFSGSYSKQNTLAELTAALSYSCYRAGDRFGFVGSTINDQRFIHPASMNRAAGSEIAAQIRSHALTDQDSRGLLSAERYLGSRRALVFLVSDFHFPTKEISRVLASLAFHDVIPIILWDEEEYRRLPRYGLARIADPESGKSRLLIMRPRLQARIEALFEARKQTLLRLMSHIGRRPLLLENGFDADEITRYFYA